MNIHQPTPSLVPHVCVCGARDSDPTWHRVPVATVSPLRQEVDALNAAIDSAYERPAVARRTDPGTSWEAARSVTDITAKQAEVLALFRERGPMTDDYAWGSYRGNQSVSGFRTRRSELVAKGLLRDTGERRVGSTGRRMIVWAAA